MDELRIYSSAISIDEINYIVDQDQLLHSEQPNITETTSASTSFASGQGSTTRDNHHYSAATSEWREGSLQGCIVALVLAYQLLQQ